MTTFPKVLMLSASDIRGGAAKIAHYTATGLRERGVSVDVWVQDKQSDLEYVHELKFEKTRRLIAKIQHRLGVNALNLEHERQYERIFANSLDDYDIVHVHDVPQNLNILDFSKILKRHNVVWTIHSMAPFTGNCVFSYDCDRWQRGCGSCPQFGSWPLIYQHRDGSALNIRAKKHVYGAAKNLNVVGVSDWVSQQLEKSILAGHPIHTVDNPSWAADYFPVDREKARQKLGIPGGSFAIMFAVSGNPADKRKGLDLIVEALGHLKSDYPDLWRKLFILPTGIIAPQQEIGETIKDISGLPPVYLSQPSELREYYSAADLIWHPSRADTSSMVCLEAQGCGTPAIAAAVGGVPEVVLHEKSGLLIAPDDSIALATETFRAFSDKRLLDSLRSGARAAAELRSSKRFIDSYLDVYEKTLNHGAR